MQIILVIFWPSLPQCDCFRGLLQLDTKDDQANNFKLQDVYLGNHEILCQLCT